MYAARQDAPDHPRYRDWLRDTAASDELLGLSDVVLSGVVRIVTNRRIFAVPSSTVEAFAFIDAVRAQPNAVPVSPGPRHWDVFSRLCREAGARGNLVTDAYLAALAIESGSTLVTTDLDFARFPGLRWRHPLR